jgi:hypothetical protein
VDPTGIGYGLAAFVTVTRTGKAGSLSRLMPWVACSGLTEAGLAAIYRALATLAPMPHAIGNVGEAKHCAGCAQEHPFGEYNKLVPPPRAAVAARNGTASLVAIDRKSTASRCICDATVRDCARGRMRRTRSN